MGITAQRITGADIMGLIKVKNVNKANENYYNRGRVPQLMRLLYRA